MGKSSRRCRTHSPLHCFPCTILRHPTCSHSLSHIHTSSLAPLFFSLFSSFFHISLSHLLFLLTSSLSVLLNFLLHHLIIIILLHLFPPRRSRCAKRATHCTTSSSPLIRPTVCTTDGARTVSKPVRHACMNA